MFRALKTHFPVRTLFLGFSEACLVVLAFLTATVARLGVPDANLMLSYEQGFLKISVVSAAFILCIYYFDLYDSSVLANPREVLTRMVQALGTVCIVLALIYYLYPPLELGRGIFLLGLLLVAILLLTWRRLFLFVNALPQFAERTLILGEGPLSIPLYDQIIARPELGLRIINYPQVASKELIPAGNSPGANDDIAQFVGLHRVSRIVVALGERRGKMPLAQLLFLKSRGVQIQDGIDFYEAITGKVPIEALHLGWLLFSPGFSVSRAMLVYERVFSFFVSALGILLSFPLVPFVALGIKLSSPGPILYRQKRVGRDGKIFNCYKFRTMRADAEADTGPTWASDDDPRITSIGRALRTLRLDEIPQLWNVFKGDMSLIGPRPERPEFVSQFNDGIPFYPLRHTIRPGITGWAQVRYGYGSSIEDAKEKLRYDLFYIKNMSPGLDLWIIFETVKIVLLGRGSK